MGVLPPMALRIQMMPSMVAIIEAVAIRLCETAISVSILWSLYSEATYGNIDHSDRRPKIAKRILIYKRVLSWFVYKVNEAKKAWLDSNSPQLPTIRPMRRIHKGSTRVNIAALVLYLAIRAIIERQLTSFTAALIAVFLLFFRQK